MPEETFEDFLKSLEGHADQRIIDAFRYLDERNREQNAAVQNLYDELNSLKAKIAGVIPPPPPPAPTKGE